MTPHQFIRQVTSGTIQGYSVVEAEIKRDWLNTGKRILRALAKDLGLQPGSYDIRINPAGLACSGDVHLHGEWIYVDLSQTALGPDFGFMWRGCSGRKDYTGHQNQWSKWDTLLNLKELADKMRKVAAPVGLVS